MSEAFDPEKVEDVPQYMFTEDYQWLRAVQRTHYDLLLKLYCDLQRHLRHQRE